MIQEIEARFLDVSHDVLRTKLRTVGARLSYPMRDMKRVIIDYPDQRLQGGQDNTWGFIRIRDEGVRVMLTYKQVGKDADRETHEIEVVVSSYEKTIEFFERIGLKVISEQHTRRESWRIDACEVFLDEWPWLPPMIEIEGLNVESVRTVAAALGFGWDDRIVGNVVDAYRSVYPGMTHNDSIRDVPVLTFETMPEWLMQRKVT